MRVWRLCSARHADLSGKGGTVVSGRWHSAGLPIIYTASNGVLALLEKRVHSPQNMDDLILLRIDLPDHSMVPVEPLYDLLPGWARNQELTRTIGDRRLAETRSLGLSVPSVLAPEGRNVLLNPQHREMSQVQIARLEAFRFDERLFGRLN